MATILKPELARYARFMNLVDSDLKYDYFYIYIWIYTGLYCGVINEGHSDLILSTH